MKIIRKSSELLRAHQKQIYVVTTCILAAGLIALILNYLMIGRYSKYVKDRGQVPQLLGDGPTGIVFGGGIENGKPTLLLQDRLDATASLLHDGYIKKIIVTGDNRFSYYDEPTVMKNYLVQEKSVDPKLIQPDFAGRSTYESCERGRKVFNLNKALLISEGTHLPRAIYLCRSFGVEAYGYASDGKSAAGLQIGQRWREVIARTKATINVYIIGEKTVLREK